MVPTVQMLIVGALLCSGCGPHAGPSGPTSGAVPNKAAQAATPRPTRKPVRPDERFGPLDIGGDYLDYRRVTPEPFLSRVHGNRWVNVYVTETGADAYLDGGEIPPGTIVVKDSWIDDGGEAGPVAGPIFVMRREAPGTAPARGDWTYAIHWARPTPDQLPRLGGPIYWRGASPRVDYCYDCHENYDRGLGGLTPSSVLYR
jgi:hypothetical protein